MTLHFFTTVTTNRYLGFLRPHLGSVLKHHPDASVTVYFHQIDSARLAGLRLSFPTVSFIQQPIKDIENKERTISGRLRWYADAATCLPNNEPMVLIDCDTLVLKSLYHFFDKHFDFGYTWKEDDYIINGGVMLARSSRHFVNMIQHWCHQIEQIFRNPKELSLARARGGAPDQYALMKLLYPQTAPAPHQTITVEERAELYDGTRTIKLNGESLLVQGFNCTYLNETHCVPITEHTHVIHYKSGWHKILLDGSTFTHHRPENSCREMFDYWRSASAKAAQQAAESVLLSINNSQVEHYRNLELDWTERGILHSEMLAVCAVAQNLGVHRIVESGRWLGQSTLALSRYFEGESVEILSVERGRTDVALACERRLASRTNLSLYYGDAFRLLPALILQSNKPTLLLVDGPKGPTAVELIHKLFDICPNIVGAFLHDSYMGSDARKAVIEQFAMCAFTDHPEFLNRYAYLDAGLSFIGEEGKYNGNVIQTKANVSYGPTLSLMLPSDNQLLPHNALTDIIRRAKWKSIGLHERSIASLRGIKYQFIDKQEHVV